MRPFITQMITNQKSAGGGSGLDTPYNYQAPNAGYFHAETLYGTSSSSTTITHYDSTGGGTDATLDGANLTDHTNAFIVLWCVGTATSTDISNAIGASTRLSEGNGTSQALTMTAGGVPVGIPGAGASSTLITHSREPVGGGSIVCLGGHWIISRPATGNNSEWGTYSNSGAGANGGAVLGTSLIILPAENATGSLGIPGAHIGRRNKTWLVATPSTGTINLDDQVGVDGEQTVSGTFNIADAGTYLLIWRARFRSVTTGSTLRKLRLSHKIDGVDPWNIRTNTKTSGATTGGRGFQYLLDAGDNLSINLFPMASIHTFTAGTHSLSMSGSRDIDADEGEIIDQNAFLAINTAVLGKFTYATFETAVTIDTTISGGAGTNDTEAIPGASVTITADGSTKIIVGFASSGMMGASGPCAGNFYIFRNGVATSQGASNQGVQIDCSSNSITNSGGVVDSDNAVMPIHWMHVETPAAGTYTYTLRAARATATSWTANCRDDGTSGFKGYMYAFEAKFATVS